MRCKSDCAIRFKLRALWALWWLAAIPAARGAAPAELPQEVFPAAADTVLLAYEPAPATERTDLASLLFRYSGIFGREPAASSGRLASLPEQVSWIEWGVPLRQFNHLLAVGFRPGYIAPSHEFLRGVNHAWKPIDSSVSFHLQYAFQFRPDTPVGRIYGSAYQGIGVGWYSFFDRQQLGDPLAVYLLQGAQIALFNPRLSLNYEWNFGLSFGWEPFHAIRNEYNRIIGSRINAYLNANFYLNWLLSHRLDLTAGVTLTHFSNGSTRLPNSGLNTIGGKVGLVYHFNREEPALFRADRFIPPFRRHMTYDLVLFGSWKEKGILRQEGALPVALSLRGVYGFNFSPMYNLGYKFRVGFSLDGVYDGSSNVEMEWSSMQGQDVFVFPAKTKQMALGVSARAEYVMPYFTVGVGMGTNVVHGGGDLNTFYQVLALKIAVTRNSFLHIGYSLKQFQSPNFLMLGIGYRFNNRPKSCRP
ncbi:MAG: acyloxyacyl hydrolase [Rikenellaceae bacterium]|nr:acyloxyacyl hydrolase [Rikenellaceae bacterium]